MAIVNTQSLQVIVDVTVQVAAGGASIPEFDQGLIVGTSAVIPSVGVNPRIRQYTSLAGMSADGFSSANPEYLAAQLYFGQTPAPVFVWIGRQDLTAVSTVAIGASGGTGYVVGDVLTIVQGGAQGGEVSVTTVASGVVTAVALVPQNQGTGYMTATNLVTTGGTGTGCEINITAIGESALQALTACRLAQVAWWACMVIGASTADAEAIAPYAQSASPTMCYFHNTTDTAVLNGTTGNLALVLSAANYKRVYGRYCTTQGGTFPNNVYSPAAAMGVAMGHNTGLANSFFTMMFQPLAGIAYEPLTPTQVNNIATNPQTGNTAGAHFNVDVDYANGAYNFEQFGTVANGQFFDEIINIDMLVADIQFSVMNLLTAGPFLPLTNAGGNQIATVVNGSCARAAARGFIQPGVWTGSQVLNLTPGTALPNGYLVQFAPYSTLTQAQLAARQASPLYVCILTPGAIQSVTIAIITSL